MKLYIIILFSVCLSLISVIFSVDKNDYQSFPSTSMAGSDSIIYEGSTFLNEEKINHKKNPLLCTFEVEELIQRQTRHRLSAIKTAYGFSNFCFPGKKVRINTGNRDYPLHLINHIPIYIMVSSIRI